MIDVDLFEPVAADAAVWPVRPAPKTGELPSSWLSRVALANGLTPRSFFRGLASRHEIAPSGAHPTMGGLRPCDPWVDHCAHPRLFVDVALRSARDPAEIAAMSLTQTTADAGSALALLAMAAPGVLRPAPSAADGAPRRSDRRLMRLGAVAFCPACLDDGEAWIPAWGRFAWARACLRHGLRLLDRCPRCRRSWAPQRIARLQPLVTCHACGADLARAATQGVTPDEAWRQWAIENRLLGQIDDARTGSRSVDGGAFVDALLRDASCALRTPIGGGAAPTIRFSRRFATPIGARRRVYQRQARP